MSTKTYQIIVTTPYISDAEDLQEFLIRHGYAATIVTKHTTKTDK